MRLRFQIVYQYKQVLYHYTQHLLSWYYQDKCASSHHHLHKTRIHRAFTNSKTSFYFWWLNLLGQIQDLIFALGFWWMDCLLNLIFRCLFLYSYYLALSICNFLCVKNLARFLIRHHNPLGIFRNKQEDILLSQIAIC